MKKNSNKPAVPSKSEIRTAIMDSMSQTLGTLKLEKPSKKASRIFKKTAKMLAARVQKELKHSLKKIQKESKPEKNSKKNGKPVAELAV